MKKIHLFLLLILLFFVNTNVVHADEWDDISAFDRSIDAQKPITNDEFEKAIEALQAPMKKKEEKQRKNKIRKISGGGTSLHNELNPSKDIKSPTEVSVEPEDLVLNLPVELLLNDGVVLEKGFYKVIEQKEKDNNRYLYFYQSQFFKGKLRAIETEDDFDSEKLDFVDITFVNDSYAKIMFCSLEVNLYAFVRYNKEIED